MPRLELRKKLLLFAIVFGPYKEKEEFRLNNYKHNRSDEFGLTKGRHNFRKERSKCTISARMFLPFVKNLLIPLSLRCIELSITKERHHI